LARAKGAKLVRGMKRPVIAASAGILLGICLAAAPCADAQDDFELPLSRIAYIEPGTYLAGDTLTFSLVQAGNVYLFRMTGTPEIFVLYADRASLGSRVLKFDSGETALRVAEWGSITLYTDEQPGGLPATRTGNASPPGPPFISLQDMQSVANDDGQHLGSTRHLVVQFDTDWNALADNSELRAFAFDTMENAARGIERFVLQGPAHEAFAHRIAKVDIKTGSRPYIALNGKTLVVTFNPSEGFIGRASSRAIARALKILLGLAH
jgi:hypothetical protein